MTKDEYLKQAWERQKKESCITDTNVEHFFYEALFKQGFNAACEYYRNHVLELNTEDNDDIT